MPVQDTLDADFHHHFSVQGRHDVVWGLGFRNTVNRMIGRPEADFDLPRRRDPLYSGFLQDELLFLDSRLSLTAGLKFEHNNYTGVEVQPGLRLLWSPDARHALWASVARAVRTPSRENNAARLPPRAER